MDAEAKSFRIINSHPDAEVDEEIRTGAHVLIAWMSSSGDDRNHEFDKAVACDCGNPLHERAVFRTVHELIQRSFHPDLLAEIGKTGTETPFFSQLVAAFLAESYGLDSRRAVGDLLAASTKLIADEQKAPLVHAARFMDDSVFNPMFTCDTAADLIGNTCRFMGTFVQKSGEPFRPYAKLTAITRNLFPSFEIDIPRTMPQVNLPRVIL